MYRDESGVLKHLYQFGHNEPLCHDAGGRLERTPSAKVYHASYGIGFTCWCRECGNQVFCTTTSEDQIRYIERPFPYDPDIVHPDGYPEVISSEYEDATIGPYERNGVSTFDNNHDIEPSQVANIDESRCFIPRQRGNGDGGIAWHRYLEDYDPDNPHPPQGGPCYLGVDSIMGSGKTHASVKLSEECYRKKQVMCVVTHRQVSSVFNFLFIVSDLNGSKY